MEMDTAILDTQKKYASRALMLAIGVGLICLVIGQKEMCRGLVLGGLFSAVNFLLMGHLLHFRLSENRKTATLRSLGAMLLRYMLLAIPLVLSVRSDRFNFPATVVGIFMVQLTIMIEHGSRIVFTALKH
jgi:hypothetical protein